ncbi:uncharacterized protein NPIL_511491 [Nephila pilipes]|uniref:Uncharacterized protein n=1 Tax=Nephila pilipes TaxID=299642 RepID=A0A8X6T831_NEPPI|nr:uncharacterized protein NPIL_511491 [Nephila pilipes]
MEIHCEISALYGSHALSRSRIVKGGQQCKDVRTDLTNEEIQRRSKTLSTLDLEDIILRYRESIVHIAQKWRTFVDSANSIAHHQLDYHILCSRRVPYSLSSEYKDASLVASLEFFQCYSAEGTDFISRIISGDEKWMHYFAPETKQASMEWRHT